MKVISVKFKENGRGYYFDPGEFQVKEGDFVIVTTARGTECGEVVRGAHEVPGFSREVKPVIRVADAVDVRRMRQNRADVQRAFQICEQRIAAHGLKMKLVDAEYTLDRGKLVFYFTADNRVDFRELVKDLAASSTPASNCARSACGMRARCWEAWACADSPSAAAAF